MSSARESLGWEGEEGGRELERGGGRRVERSSSFGFGVAGEEDVERFREEKILKMKGMATNSRAGNEGDGGG